MGNVGFSPQIDGWLEWSIIYARRVKSNWKVCRCRMVCDIYNKLIIGDLIDKNEHGGFMK